MRASRASMQQGLKAVLLLVGVAVLVAAFAAPACAFASARRSPCDEKAGVSECRTRLVAATPSAPGSLDRMVGSDGGAFPEAPAGVTARTTVPTVRLFAGFRARLRI